MQNTVRKIAYLTITNLIWGLCNTSFTVLQRNHTNIYSFWEKKPRIILTDGMKICFNRTRLAICSGLYLSSLVIPVLAFCSQNTLHFEKEHDENSLHQIFRVYWPIWSMEHSCRYGGNDFCSKSPVRISQDWTNFCHLFISLSVVPRNLGLFPAVSLSESRSVYLPVSLSALSCLHVDRSLLKWPVYFRSFVYPIANMPFLLDTRLVNVSCTSDLRKISCQCSILTDNDKENT